MRHEESPVPDSRHRRSRYPIKLDLRWNLTRQKVHVDRGTGRTVDLSSVGIRFQTDRELPIGEDIELSIHWSAMLNEVTPSACGCRQNCPIHGY